MGEGKRGIWASLRPKGGLTLVCEKGEKVAGGHHPDKTRKRENLQKKTKDSVATAIGEAKPLGLTELRVNGIQPM